MSKVVHVAVGVVFRADGKILIARRPDHLHMGGRWEFPGGKVEVGETVQDALCRELLEEVAIEVQQLQPLLEVRHDYPDKTVLLDTWQVTQFSGEARGQEQQDIQWVSIAELDKFQFPDANQAIIDAVKANFS
ncbi:8-oxo-dGTP diphosphatase MutT [Microbulbifer sp. OS29]|uniref:8-oxo-dGTP diphosphatase n=1 Tax=Microbulbifer okhotskensis TaxID=2926617 RepID=A0A9X2J5J5_9GAMM|nr:8-oxo-dGTP diphosphatase MutT [Microbulbifer okhotskensis]MCO1333675.1 8-oxo-dGTP diphosphatase MutT [Microbulbifer okhotskensis]